MADSVSPTQGLSALIEKILTPLVSSLKTFIKDDWDFLRKLPCDLDYSSVFISCDIISCTRVSISLGLKAIEYWLLKKRDLIPERFTNEIILESTNFVVLSNNNFLFNDEMFHQNNGTAMGTKLAPPYACLSHGFLEETILFTKILPHYFSPQVCVHIENKYKRYMDDGFLSLPGTIDISTFLSCMNSQHPDIKFTTKTATISQSTTGDYYQSLDFLDILVILHSNGKIETEIFYKITNAHDYLEFNSQHPFHILKNIPYNLAKEIIIFTSDDKKNDKTFE